MAKSKIIFVMMYINIILLQLVFSLNEEKTDLYVGYPGNKNNYPTISLAIAACVSISPKSESERITIHIAPGIYREQVIINTPYITLVNDDVSSKDVTITWYYGIGYSYYSMGSDGRYNEDNARSKTGKGEAKRWGGTVQLQSKASDFKAKNIIFENSFNRYITNDEIEDGVEVSGSTSITFERTISADVRKRSATERAAAMTIDADRAEFYNCQFYSSQDTLYTGGKKGYFKKCKIEGNTDYIFGGGDYVFDQCRLSFYGYADKSAGGVITAALEQTEIHGYLFYNCKVVANPDLMVGSGAFGRPWRQTAVVLFYNTIVEKKNTISDAAWTSMACDPTEANFMEYNTTLPDGTAVNVSKRKGKVLSDDEAKNISVQGYLEDWVPSFIGE